MCACGSVLVLLAAVAATAHGQSYYQNGYGGYPNSDITHRAAERTRYETELTVSCDTGDDRACFEHFLSVNRMYLAIAAGVIGFLILVSFCVCCCCFCKRKRHHRIPTSSRA